MSSYEYYSRQAGLLGLLVAFVVAVFVTIREELRS